ncbi:MAG: sugar transferase [Ktedonobacteraceae bacterium]
MQSVSVETIQVRTSYITTKRIMDITFILLISPFVLFICAVIALCIKLDSKGPVFYRQKRIGQNGIEFEMLKFRSMYTNSDQQAHREKIMKYMSGEKLNKDGSSNLAYKDAKDPRITRVGRFIRKTSLDELPQFWNVLCGEMTLVGPRPPLAYEVELYSAHDCLRLSGKPGLTGTWQVYGRSRVTFQDMVEMDIEYLENQSLWRDIKLVICTVPVMIFARGGA